MGRRLKSYKTPRIIKLSGKASSSGLKFIERDVKYIVNCILDSSPHIIETTSCYSQSGVKQIRAMHF